MIRKAGDGVSNEKELRNILNPCEKEILKFMKEFIVYELATFHLASSFNNDCIWADSSLENEYLDAIDYFNCTKPKFKEIDKERIKKMLEEKYHLRIVNENPIQIEKVQ